jgi:hypothetical protein
VYELYYYLIFKGRAAIYQSNSYSEVYSIAFKLENSGLIVSIMQASAVRRQNLAWNILLVWLRDLQQRMNMYKEVARRMIFEELFMEISERPDVSVFADIETKVWKNKDAMRIDLFLNCDILLWSSVRRCLKELFINALITDSEIQREFGLRFAMNYVRMANSFLLYDDNPDLSLLHLSLEFFRSPEMSSHLVTKTPMFSTICNFLVLFKL